MKNKGYLLLFKIVAGFAVVVLSLSLIIAFEIYSSANWLEVNHFTFESEKIDEPIKLVVLSDLHDHDFKGELEKKIKEEAPDIIIMAGDMINADSDKSQQLYNLINKLNEIAPVYYGLGNHEETYIENINSSFIEDLESNGCEVIDYEYEDLNINGNKIRLGGLYDYPYGLGACLAKDASDEIKAFMEDFIDTNDFKLMIAHRPESYIYGDDSKVYPIDMVVAGHIHGGQVVVPFKGGLWGGDQGWWPKYVHGIYEKDNIHMIITSGLGTSRKKFPRFNNRPEIMVLTIKSSKG